MLKIIYPSKYTNSKREEKKVKVVGKTGEWEKNHRIPTRINKILIPSRVWLCFFHVLSYLQPLNHQQSRGLSHILPSVQTAVQDRLFWIYWFLHKLITPQPEYIRLNYPILWSGKKKIQKERSILPLLSFSSHSIWIIYDYVSVYNESTLW